MTTMQDAIRLTLDLDPGSHHLLKNRLREVNAHRGENEPRLTATSLATRLTYAWLDGDVELPESTVRLTFDMPVGSYVRFRDKVKANNALLPKERLDRAGLVGKPHRLTQEGVLRRLIYGQFLNGASSQGSWNH